jgi:2-polyprenyl-3-methyl-5-hydroxy-6-metoxy-1,4-benzoquinol methylase
VSHDRAAWEARWARALEQHGDRLAQHAPNALVTGLGLPAGRALDAGCGHGAEALWLAGRGWRVTAVDFAATALARARATADALGVEVDWVEADLGAWSPEPDAFDLVLALFVHVAGDVGAFVRRLAAGVAPGGTLLLAGYRPASPGPGDQVQVSVDAARAALDPARWELLLAEERPRSHGPAGTDALVRARRRP